MLVPLVDVVLCPKTESWSIKNQDLCAYAPSTNLERPESDIAILTSPLMTVPVPPPLLVPTIVIELLAVSLFSLSTGSLVRICE